MSHEQAKKLGLFAIVAVLVLLAVTEVSSFAYEHNSTPPLSSVTLQNSRGYYFINLFCGYWPVPKKYIVEGTTSEGNIFLFGDGTRFDITADVMSSGGNIEFGKYSEPAVAEKFKFRGHEFEVTKKDYHGFKVSIYDQKVVPEKLPRTVLIHDMHQYIQISDPDDNFWKESLDAFLRIRSGLPKLYGKLFNAQGKEIDTSCKE